MKGRFQEIMRWVQQLKPYRANQRYNQVRGSLLSAGIAYYAFFSVFPAVAIAAVVFGFVLRDNQTLLQQVGNALNSALPGFVKTDSNPDGLIALTAPSLSVLTISGIIAVVTLILAGIGWIGSFREGIRASLGAPVSTQSAVAAKLLDLLVFVGFGFLFLLEAVLTSVLGAGTTWISQHIGLGDNNAVVYVVGLLGGYAVDTALLLLLLRVLSGVKVPWADLRQSCLVGGALLGVVKIFGTTLIANATKNPLLGAVAVTIGLLFWLNLIARIVLLAASWAYLDLPAGLAADSVAAGTEAGGDQQKAGVTHTSVRVIPPAGAAAGVVDPAVSRSRDGTAIATGAILGAALASLLAGALRRGVAR